MSAGFENEQYRLVLRQLEIEKASTHEARLENAFMIWMFKNGRGAMLAKDPPRLQASPVSHGRPAIPLIRKPRL